MSGCCRGLPAKVCWARPYGCSDEPPDRSSLVGGAQKDMSDPKTTAAADWDHEACVRLVIQARNIMRAILFADERGQGVNFCEAMDAAEAFCCDIEAIYAEVMKEASHGI